MEASLSWWPKVVDAARKEQGGGGAAREGERGRGRERVLKFERIHSHLG